MQLKEWIDDGPERLSELARAIAAQPQLVWQWALGQGKPNGRRVPQHRCPAIEVATAGQVTCEEMRPDLNWVRVMHPEWRNGKPLLDLLEPKQQETATDRRKRSDRRSGQERRQTSRRAGEPGDEGA